MKKFLLILLCLFVFNNFKSIAQDFDYDLTAADPAVGSFPTITQGGITLTTTAPVATDGSSPVYKMLNINSNSFAVVLESSTTDIRQAIYFLRGAGNAATATPVVTYGVSSTDPNMVTAPAQSATASAPGIPLQYDFPLGTKYVRMVRNATVRLYRITAGSSVYTLPLDFLSFTAKPDALGKSVNLNWSTTNEVNTKNFEIQKRTDVTEFATIGTLSSKNVSGVHQYAFIDNNASQGNAYYRLLQYDLDGAFKASEIVAVTNKSNIALSVYPNPVDQTLNINHPSTSATASIRILSLDGKVVLEKSLSANLTTTDLDVSQLNAGSYLVLFQDQAEKSSLKFIKK